MIYEQDPQAYLKTGDQFFGQAWEANLAAFWLQLPTEHMYRAIF